MGCWNQQKLNQVWKKERTLLTRYPKLPRAIKSIEEVSIFIIAYAIANSPHTFYIGTPFACVPESFVFGEGLGAIDVGDLNRWRLAYIGFYEGDVECHYCADWVGGELERDNVEVIKHFNEKGVKRNGSSSSNNCLRKDSHARRKIVQPVIQVGFIIAEGR